MTSAAFSVPTADSASSSVIAAARVGEAAVHFDGGRGYLNACSLGIPPRSVAQVLQEDTAAWLAGQVTPGGYRMTVEETRLRFARLLSCSASEVAIGSQTSVIASLFAAAVPPGAEVLCVEGDFSSMVYPFLVAARVGGYTVRHVPVDEIADSVTARTALISFSLIQSVDGTVADAAAIRAAAAAHGALTLCDLTQAAGAIPVAARDFDATITNAYKWLMCPRGVVFLTIGERAASVLRPLHAGWYAGRDIADSFYGPSMDLADDARRFDVSPAFSAWVGANAALEFLEQFDIGEVWNHDVALADAFAEGIGSSTRGRSIVTVDDPEGLAFAALRRAGMQATAPAGRLRVSFHIWNTPSDVHLAVSALDASGYHA